MGTTIKKQAIISFFLICLLECCKTGQPAYLKFKDESGQKLYHSKKEFLKEYALCSCLLQNSPGDSSKATDASQGVYYDLSDDDLIINHKGKIIDSNAAAFIDARRHLPGSTYENRKTPFLDCVTYFKSRSLDKLIDSLLRTEKKR